MTVSTDENRKSYVGNDITTELSFPYLFFASSDLVVIEVDDVTAVETNQILDTDYTVTGAGDDAGGVVITTTPPATGKTWVIVREIPLTQGLDLVENGPLPAEEVEVALDKNTMMAQQNATNISRSLVLPSGFTDDFDGTLPTPVADTSIVFNPAGNGLASGPTISEISNAQTYATNAENSAIAAAADAVTAAAEAAAAVVSAAEANAAALGFKDVVTITTGSHDLETTDSKTYYVVDSSGGTVTINLPLIGTEDGINYKFERVGANTVTIVRDGTDYINGVSGNYTMAADTEVIQFISDDNTPDNWIANIQSQTKAGNGITKTGSTFSADLDVVSAVTRTVEADTSTALTLALTNAGNVVTMNNAAANVVTIPANATVAVPVNSQVDGMMLGVGVTSITAAAGVTLNGVVAGTAAISAQYAGWTLLKVATDEWVLTGNHGGVA